MFGGLMFGGLMFGGLMFGGLMFGGLMFGGCPVIAQRSIATSVSEATMKTTAPTVVILLNMAS
jgi:hypothetical protein